MDYCEKMYFQFCEIGGFELLVASIGAVVSGAIIAAIKAVRWWIDRDENKIQQRVRQITGDRDISQVVHWSEITGPQRPVTVAECKENHTRPCLLHDSLQEDIQVNTRAVDVQAQKLEEIKDALADLKGDIREGFAKMPGKITMIVSEHLERHERLLHRTSSGNYTGLKRKED